MAVVGGQIGAFVFIRLEGTVHNIQTAARLESITAPWEDGELYRLMGRHLPTVELIGILDLWHGYDIPNTMRLYRNAIGSYLEVRQWHGNSYASYPNMLVLDVENITPPERMNFIGVVGGINGPSVGGESLLLTTRWRLHYCLPQ